MMDLSVAAAAGVLRPSDENLNESSRAERVGYQTSPHAPNTPENNDCQPVDYRGAKVASFCVNGKRLICLPQAFELFLKHLVGGLHTVYTKLKRLEITPVVCNVEQVRVLRSSAAIQPGVNRCKLISPKEFDVLYNDCTSSSARPGRPPKRSSFFNPAEMQEMSPSKQIRKAHAENNIFQLEDLKNVSPGGMLPHPHGGGYPPLPIPGMPFVSPYQINLMHQAAVQMALANQLQSNLARAKEGIIPAPLALNHLNRTSPVINSQQLPDTTCQQPPMTSPPALRTIHSPDPSPPMVSLTTEKIETKQHLNENNNSVPCHNAVSVDRIPSQRSPASCCSEDLDVEDRALTPVDIEARFTSPRNTMPTPPPSSPRDFGDAQESLMQPKSDHGYKSIISDTMQSPQSQPSIDCQVDSRLGRSPTLSADRQSPLVTDSDRRNMDDILLNIKSDIQTFMESVVQHQEEILGDIEILRRRLKTQTYDQQFIETFMREQQQMKAHYQAQIERDSIKKHQINNLLHLTNAELSNRQWWNRNPSLS